jgi:hypothetical protein
MTIPLAPPLERTSPAFPDQLDNYFLEWIPDFTLALDQEIERINSFAFGSYSATSTTSLTVGTGSKTLTVEPGKGFTLGQPVLIASTAAPSTYMNGQVTAYDSTTGVMTVNVTSISGSGTAASWSVSVSAVVLVSAAKIAQRTITGTDTLTAGDFGKLVNLNGTFTLTPDAAATLGAGWWCWLRNVGTGTPTLDPTGAETVDGVASGPVRGTILLVCDGTGFTAVKQGPFTTTEVLTSGTSWTAPLGVRTLHARGQGGTGGKGGGSPASGGGGGGGFDVTVPIAPGAAYAYAIGAAGVDGTAAGNGSPGGSTTLTVNGTTYTADGGGGGVGAGASGTPSLGGSGSGTGALILRGGYGMSSGSSSYFGRGALNYLTSTSATSAGVLILEY